MITKEYLVSLREKVTEQWRGKLSLLDHIIDTYDKNELLPEDTAPHVGVLLAAKDKEPERRNPVPKPPTKPVRRSRSGSHREVIRQAVENADGPFGSDQIVKQSGEEQRRVSTALSTWRANGMLTIAGESNGRVLYQKTDKWVVHTTSTVAEKYAEFRDQIAEPPKK